MVIEQRNFNEVAEQIREAGYFALDTETTGLHYRDKLLIISLAWPHNGEVQKAWIPLYSGGIWQDDVQRLGDVLRDPTITLVGHRLTFDVTVLRKHGFMVKNKYFDTKVAALILNPYRLTGLKRLSNQILGAEMTEYRDLLKKHGAKTVEQLPVEVAYDYATKDAIYTLKLYSYFKPELESRGILDYFNSVEMSYIDCICDMQLNGVQLDLPKLADLEKVLTARREELIRQIYQEAGTEFNLNSSKQLGDILYNKLGYRAKVKTKTGANSTNKATLEELGQGGIIDLLLDYRSIEKLLGTYVIPFQRLCDSDTRLRGSFNQAATVTGRLSSSSPNLQNIPSPERDEYKIRDLFIAREGYDFIVADYRQFEFRIIAALSNDPVFMDGFKNGLDVHEQTAAVLFGPAMAKSKRSLAKTINFGLLYGMGMKKLSISAKISMAEAKRHMENYDSQYSEFCAWRRRTIRQAESMGYVFTLGGRKCLIEPGFAYKGIDYIAQGSAADIMKKAQTEIRAEVPELVHCLQVHDELVFECPEQLSDQAMEKVKMVMCRQELPGVGLDVSIKKCKKWGEGK